MRPCSPLAALCAASCPEKWDRAWAVLPSPARLAFVLSLIDALAFLDCSFPYCPFKALGGVDLLYAPIQRVHALSDERAGRHRIAGDQKLTYLVNEGHPG